MVIFIIKLDLSNNNDFITYETQCNNIQSMDGSWWVRPGRPCCIEVLAIGLTIYSVLHVTMDLLNGVPQMVMLLFPSMYTSNEMPA